MYRWIDHTAELELAIEAPSDAGVFADALAALGQLLGEEAGGEALQGKPGAHVLDRCSPAGGFGETTEPILPCSLPCLHEDPVRQLGRAAATDEVDRAVEVDIRANSEVTRLLLRITGSP